MTKNLKIILPSDADMLTYIRENGPCNISDIEKATSLQRKYIKKSIKRLMDDNYLENIKEPYTAF